MLTVLADAFLRATFSVIAAVYLSYLALLKVSFAVSIPLKKKQQQYSTHSKMFFLKTQEKLNEKEINFIKSVDFDMSNETAFIAIFM